MSSLRLALAIGLASLAVVERAQGQAIRADAPLEGSAGPIGGSARSFAFLDAPPPAPRPLAPGPARESDEYARKSWEFFPEAGFGTPTCRGDSLGPGRCGDSGSGTVLGGGALYRVSPYVALGAVAAFANFQFDRVAPSAYSHASFVGFAVRGYFSDRGAIDPYVETGIGRGTSTMGYAGGGVEIRSEAAGPSAMASAGIDFWVMPYLKLGPALAYRWTWLTEVRTCAGSTCETARVADWGAIGSYATVSFAATLLLGQEM
jgi:hypothetical protein